VIGRKSSRPPVAPFSENVAFAASKPGSASFTAIPSLRLSIKLRLGRVLIGLLKALEYMHKRHGVVARLPTQVSKEERIARLDCTPARTSPRRKNDKRGGEAGLLSRKGVSSQRFCLLQGLVLAGGLSFQLLKADAPRPGLLGDPLAATFVGSETCAGCHRAEAELWHGSQHKHAMDHATEKSMLGNFSDATLRLLRAYARAFLFARGDKFSSRDRRHRRQTRQLSRSSTLLASIPFSNT